MTPELVELEELLTGADVARRLGVSRTRAHQLASLPGFPAPLGRVGQAKVWRAADVDAWAERARQDVLEVVNSDGVVFRTIPNKPGYLRIVEPDGKVTGAVTWAGAVLLELKPTAGGVLVRTARQQGRVSKTFKGYWTLSDAWPPGERPFD